MHCCVIDSNYPALNYYTQRVWQISELWKFMLAKLFSRMYQIVFSDI